MASTERTLSTGNANLPANAETLFRLLVSRFSCRGYLPEPVPREQIETMLSIAQYAASWCNSQPWQVHVTEGEATERFRTLFYEHALADSQQGGKLMQTDLPFPAQYTGVYKERQREVGWQLYDAVGVQFGDRVASGKQALENFRLFGAPHALLITSERDLGTYGVLDCGSYLGTLVLAAESLGIGMIPQAAFAAYSPILREFFDIPENRVVVCGASFGYPDRSHPANGFRSRRAELTDAITWLDR